MKIYVYSFLIIGLLVACSDNRSDIFPGIEETEVIDVYLKLGAGVETRLDREPTQSDLSATVYTAILYFMDNQADPACISISRVGADETADITIDELRAGALLSVPNSTSQVYVVGNWNSCDAAGNYADFPQVPGVRLSEIRATVLNINQVAYGELADGTVTGNRIAVMDGQAPIQEYNSTTQSAWTGGQGPVDGDFFASFTLTPVVARLEWEIIWIAINANIYTLEEIFINNYYQDLPLNLYTEGYFITHNGDVAARYTPGNSLFAYTNYRVMYNPVYYNAMNTGDVDTGVTAGAGNVFAFHVFGNTPPPELVIRFTDITYRNNPGVNVPQGYATVRFRDQSTGENIPAFERNKIYKPYQFINDESGVQNGFRIEYTPLPPTPNPAPDVDIIVYLVVEDWVNVDINAVL